MKHKRKVSRIKHSNNQSKIVDNNLDLVNKDIEISTDINDILLNVIKETEKETTEKEKETTETEKKTTETEKKTTETEKETEKETTEKETEIKEPINNIGIFRRMYNYLTGSK